MKVVWKNQTHFVLLDTTEHDVDADGIKARASALVVKIIDPMNYSVHLPSGGKAEG